MKQKDIATIIAAVGVAAILSFLLCSKLINTPANRQQKVEVVTPITPEFNLPDKAVFNNEAINPTKVIQIGPNTNEQPFVKQ